MVKFGDYVIFVLYYCMMYDNLWLVVMKFMFIGVFKIYDNRQVVMMLDYDVQNKSEVNLKKYCQIEEFVGKYGVDFYFVGWGIGYQIMVEEGYVWLGIVIVVLDFYSNMYGGVGCLGIFMVCIDVVSIWVIG